MRHTSPTREVTHKGIKNLKNPKNKLYILRISQLDFFLMKLRKGPINCCDPLRQRALWKISTHKSFANAPLSYPSVPVNEDSNANALLSLSHTHTHSHDHIFSLTRVCYHSLTHFAFLGICKAINDELCLSQPTNQPQNPILTLSIKVVTKTLIPSPWLENSNFNLTHPITTFIFFSSSLPLLLCTC